MQARSDNRNNPERFDTFKVDDKLRDIGPIGSKTGSSESALWFPLSIGDRFTWLPKTIRPVLITVGPRTISFVVAFPMRPTLLVTGSLLIGFAIGWLVHGDKSPTSSDRTPATQPASQVAKDMVTLPTSLKERAEAPTPRTTDAFTRRTEAIRELKPFGFMLYIRAFTRDGFDPKLLSLLELTPEQSSRLNEAAHKAERDIVAARIAGASSHTSEDGRKLIVDVPPIDISTSRGIYDQLFNTLRTTLSPEKQQLFNELTGESYEVGFDRYGLNPFRYEVELPATGQTTDSPVYFSYKRLYLDATGNGSGWAGSNLDYNGIKKHDPILGHFITPEMRSKLKE